jgi:hypothetical protein
VNSSMKTPLRRLRILPYLWVIIGAGPKAGQNP